MEAESSNKQLLPAETEITLKLPEGSLAKLLYIFFFPSYLIIYALPNYQKNPCFRKLLITLSLYLLVVIGLMILIDWMTFKIAINFSAYADAIGVSLISIGLQLPFL